MMFCDDVQAKVGGAHCTSCHDDEDGLAEGEFQGSQVAMCCNISDRAQAFEDAISRATPCYCDNIGRALCPKHRVPA